MSGSLNNNIITLFRRKFENNCIQLLLESYNSIVISGISFKEKDENEITVALIGLMRKSPNSVLYKIDICREYNLDEVSNDINLQVHPDMSPRIDIRFMNWMSPNKVEYFIEAKNLAENDWKKSSVKTPIRSKKLRERYINTGIDNFISGRYKRGCLVGYILEGDPMKIVSLINELLSIYNRSSEHLKKTNSPMHKLCFLSNHLGKVQNELTHFMLVFT